MYSFIYLLGMVQKWYHVLVSNTPITSSTTGNTSASGTPAISGTPGTISATGTLWLWRTIEVSISPRNLSDMRYGYFTMNLSVLY